MKTIAEIREITQSAIEEREKKCIEACTTFIEDVIEPNILIRAKNGYVCTFIDSSSLVLSQVSHIIDIYEAKGYKVKYNSMDEEIEIRWE